VGIDLLAPRERRSLPNAAKPLADPPNPDCPSERGQERRPHHPTVKQSETDKDLDHRGKAIEEQSPRVDQMRDQSHRSCDEAGLPDRVWRDDLRNERRSKHERLQLQPTVAEPDQAERDLQCR
jgi:hypothetical protein